MDDITIQEFFNIDEFGIDSRFVNKVVPNEFRVTSTYIVSPTFFLEEEGWCCDGTVRVLHQKPGIPSKDNVHTYLITPEDSTQQNAINIISNGNESIAFQRFTELRGAVVADQGNPDLRHRLVIVNDGALCLESFVEIVNRDEGEFRFRSGSIEFGNDMACIMFRDRSKFVIEENAHMDYGHHGHGLIAFFPGTSIEIERGGSLNFGGHMILREGDYNQPISVHLGPDQTLKFNAGAKIFPFVPEAQFTIYMEGGLLDIEELDPQYLPYLNIVYPESVRTTEMRHLIYPNPVTDILNIYSENESADYKVYDLIGRQVEVSSFGHGKILQLDFSTLNSGVYFIKGERGDLHKVIKER